MPERIRMTVARWHTGTKADTLVFLRDCDKDTSVVLNSMAEMEAEEHERDWDVCVLECRVCGHQHTTVCPHEMSYADNECFACGEMTADVLEVHDGDQN